MFEILICIGQLLISCHNPILRGEETGCSLIWRWWNGLSLSLSLSLSIYLSISISISFLFHSLLYGCTLFYIILVEVLLKSFWSFNYDFKDNRKIWINYFKINIRMKKKNNETIAITTSSSVLQVQLQMLW